MTVAPAIAIPGFLAAAVFSVLGPRYAVTARVLAALSALLLLPVIDSPSGWPFLAMAAGAAVLASPLPCVLAAAGATLVALRPEAASGPLAPVALGLGTALAAGAVCTSARDRLDRGAEPAGVVAVTGAALVALLLRLDGGGVLHWAFGLGSGASRLEMPGAGLLLGLALLACLGGTLLLGAHFLAPAVGGARLLGLRLLLPGATLGVLAAAHIVLQGLLQKRDALAAGASAVAALVLLGGALAAALGCVFAADEPTVPVAAGLPAARETALAVALTWLAVAMAGWEGWRAEGTYFSASAADAVATGLFGFGALAPTSLPGPRRLLLLVALAAVLLFPDALR